MSQWSVNRINALIEEFDLANYLEIGVFGGQTFFRVQAVTKVGVDPAFRFDPKERVNNKNEEYFSVTSDDFFKNHAGDRRWDCVFLDGLHYFEQTFRDFCNVVTNSHESTIIVIDDVVPSDIYSSFREPRFALSLRKEETGSESISWHGDVYKTIFAIEEFFPRFQYATIMKGGNPQTILWRENREPIFDCSVISENNELAYLNFKKNFEIMNPVDNFDEIISRIRIARTQKNI
ncbi:Methyltransferase domain-containing protein [Allochromatium warmingii]|uniref:Methyltransferase domain-containing protein n=1 Tax=Allochromatium warmingii TaxID=61595 RepID=A0A1H3E1H9_ALLWA|nr:class I SAM-dependent methyltransferase [Allochromatium warmingii]SDX72572.1 Methyltransferase domain-containing protein [Allochromatium warmingii]